MDSPWQHEYEIVPYEPWHRQAVRDICAATAWADRPAPEVIGDGWIWVEFWTRYFTDREPQHTWLVRRRTDGEIAGYLTGTVDIRNVDRFSPWLFPGIVWHVIRYRLMRRPGVRRALLGMARAHVRGELELPAWVRQRYPGAWHFNLLPQARGRGLGQALFERFLTRIRRCGVAGIHAQTLGNNEGVARFIRAAGFRMVHAQPTRAFAHVASEPLCIYTWVQETR